MISELRNPICFAKCLLFSALARQHLTGHDYVALPTINAKVREDGVPRHLVFMPYKCQVCGCMTIPWRDRDE
jgi:hypothetical protein